MRHTQTVKLNEKLNRLSAEQGKPLFDIDNTVLCHELREMPPKYVIETLALGPKNSVLEKFDPKVVLAELDELMSYCSQKGIDDEIVNSINVKTLNYIKNCSKQKASRHVYMTKRYLKEKGLLAIPFDKGIGICIMTVECYKEKMFEIINLPQFTKVVPERKNAKHPLLKEEEKIIELLKELKKEGHIGEKLFKKLRPTGSQPARLYGLAKIHKPNIPMRPVVSMPGSSYHKIAKKVSKWLSIVEECNINTSTKEIVDSLPNIVLPDGHQLVSFDVCSLYTNVPVQEAIDTCSDLLYSGKYKEPPVSKETFTKLLKICTSDVLILTSDGYYRQTDGLAMGSPPAPLLANGWLNRHENDLKGDAVLYHRYMDDIVRDIHVNRINPQLESVNKLQPPNLKFTIEKE